MNIISRAMEKGLPICEDETMQNQTWEAFEEKKKGKKLFLFGTGGGTEYFLRNYKTYRIAGALDNDAGKQGRTLGWLCAEAWRTEYEEIPVWSPLVLENFCGQDVIVLITVVSGYGVMVDQLKRMGIENIFVLRMLEANSRGGAREGTAGEEDWEEERDRHAAWCCRQSIGRKKIVMRIGEYGGHARAITRQLLKTGENLDIVWLVIRPDADVPEGVRSVWEKNWRASIFEWETAKIWLADDQVPDFLIKRPEQIYIQAKHWAGVTLKKFGLEDKSIGCSPEIRRRITKDGARTDYLLSGSRFDEDSCRSGWAFRGKAIRVGSPRSDILFDKSVREKVRAEWKLEKDARILLYAPTFRRKDLENDRKMLVTLDMELVLRRMSEKFGGDWFLFVRLHPLIRFERSSLQEQGHIIYAGEYADGEALVAAADAMITDYSSIMFEAAFIRKPVFLYAPDKEAFMEKDREFLLDYDALPFPAAKSSEELGRRILGFDSQKYEADLEAFFAEYGVEEDGHASERASDFILDLLGEKQIRRIVLYGAGLRGRRLLEAIRHTDLEQVCIVDSDERKWGSRLPGGYTVLPPDCLGRESNTFFHIALADPENAADVRKDLREKYHLDPLREIGSGELRRYLVRKHQGFRKEIVGVSDRCRESRILFDCCNGLGLGGIEAWTMDICSNLYGRYKERIRIVSKRKEDNIRIKEPIGRIVDYLDMPDDSSWLEEIESILRYLLRNLPCTVITSQPDFLLMAAGIIKKYRAEQIRIISVIHGDNEAIYRDYDIYKNDIDLYVGVSRDIQRELIRRGVEADRVFSMTCPFLCEEKLSRSYTDRPDPLRIGYAGRMDGLEPLQKRMDLLLKLIGRLEEKEIRFYMELAGDGPARLPMERILRESGAWKKVKFLGRLDRGDMSDFWKRQDICVNLADYEGRCISTIEAMGNGAVPVVTETSGVREDIRNGTNGYFVPVGDYEGICERIEYLEANRGRLPEMGKSAHDTIYPKSRMETHLDFWETILGVRENA
ncbi:MAG: glycosyltransferase [Lachnospiraceae bacterium]|nr:glycosyltransferase [Lachnospiraceae bacterium]